MKKIIFMFFLVSLGANANEYIGVGGGYDVFHSEASLQSNVMEFEKLTKKEKRKIFFGTGNQTELADLYINQIEPSIEENFLSFIFDLTDTEIKSNSCKAIHNQIPNLSGSSNKDLVFTSLDQYSSDTRVKNFRFYFTGHGGADSKLKKNDDLPLRERYSKNNFYLFDSTLINVYEFVEKLDQFPPETNIQNVMVQCYSGGFSQMNFKGGKLKLDNVSSDNRCGFFSQVPDRIASGCTPDIEKNEGYSKYFLQAYGEKKDSVDFNSDKSIGTDEAHAFVIMNNKSLDVPVTTSSEFLRDVLFLKNMKPDANLLSKSLKEVSKAFSPVEKKIMQHFQSYLNNLDQQVPIFAALSTKVKEYENLIKEKEDAITNMDETSSKDILKAFIQSKYPDLYKDFGNNLNMEMIQKRNSQMTSAQNDVSNSEYYKSIIQSMNVNKEADNVVQENERKKAIYERLKYLVETKLLEEYFKATPDLKKYYDRYENLKVCEAQPYFN